jgi:superfamily II DNA or RNA helicase
MKITRSDISRVIDNPAYYQRGVSYFSDRKVLTSRLDLDGRIVGSVAGSGGRVYSVDASLGRGADGRLSDVDGHCSCPIGYNCKHVTAVLLEVAQMLVDVIQKPATSQNPNRVRTSVKANLPGSVMTWLDRLSLTDTYSPTPTVPKTSSNQIFFVFRRSYMGQAEITPYKAYVKKDGTVGKNTQEYNERHSLYDAPSGTTIEDAIIFAQLRYLSINRYPSTYNWPQGEALCTLLQQIVATGRAKAETINGSLLEWTEPRHVAFQWQLDAQGDQTLSPNDLDGRALLILPFPDPVFIDAEAGVIGFVETDMPTKTMNVLAVAPIIPAEAVDTVSEMLTIHAEGIPKPMPVVVNEVMDLLPSMNLKLFGYKRQERSNYYGWRRIGTPQEVIYPCIRSHLTYGENDTCLAPGEGADIRHRTKGEISIIRRNFEAETRLVQQLEVTAEEFEGYHPDLLEISGRVPKPMNEASIIFPQISAQGPKSTSYALDFMAEGLPQLRKLGWKIEIDKSWPVHFFEGVSSFQTVVEPSGQDWFSLSLQLDVDGTPLDVTPTIMQILASLPLDEFGTLPEGFELEIFLSDVVLYQSLPNGTLVPIPGTKLTGFVEAFLEIQGMTRFHQAEAGRARQLIEALHGCGAEWQGGPELLELGKRLQNLATISDEEIPASLKAELRPYQRIGYGWLKALSDNGFGGILADDMGLGKTVQTLALLANRHLENKSDRPSLLVVPTSLIGNWQTEAKRFAPDLKLLTLHGSDRHKRLGQIANSDLVITTYPLINRDHETLFAYEFDLAILDEAQAVKNPASNVAKRIRDIKARQRIALTGTPVENNLTELWALYDWLIPGFLGDRKSFASEYRNPIEQKGDQARQRLLSNRVKPFLLRRTKDEVADDLPPKTVIDEVITLTGKQAALYESVRSAMDTRVREALAQKGLAGSRITVLDALLKLRQVCCDPKLVKLDAAANVKESAKFSRLMEILEELMSEGRKVLIFSQFVEMLRLIEGEVQSRGWSYAMLHGQTRDRPGEIDEFQSGDAQLFLISLKAGGTGLNLTAADTVILYDPWWNPAVERQAMDRAHRIGQDKPVFVHRLYTSGTVESAIQDMQARKQALADALFEGTSGGPMGLTENDLTALFGSKV